MSAYASLETSGLLVPGEAGYRHAKSLHGVLVELEDDTGEVYAFLGVSSGQISNDHYAFYELVFSGPAGPAVLDLCPASASSTTSRAPRGLNGG